MSAEPIVAIATAPGRGGVGIVRISGTGLESMVTRLLGRALRPREATYLAFPDAQGRPIDVGLALFFPAPNSFTGEDVLELQAHGGPVVLQLLVQRCLELAKSQLPGQHGTLLQSMRLARPGEFTQRAFLNGKIDLAQAEAVADLIDASSEAAARSAARSLSGAFSAEIHGLLGTLTHLRMQVEATLDFPEEDVDLLEQADAKGQLNGLLRHLATLRAQSRQGALLREGLRVVIAGQPNAGKSSLLNALAGAELAIVTPIPGTTRDKVQQTIQIEGVPLQIIDTAGLRETKDDVEKLGVQRAWGEIANADVVLFMHDLERMDDDAYQVVEMKIGDDIAATMPPQVPVIDLWNKVDVVGAALPNDRGLTIVGRSKHSLAISAKTGEGILPLRQTLLNLVGWETTTEGLFLARDRHLHALDRVQQHLEMAAEIARHPFAPLELFAEELRLAQRALGEITGEFTADELLGVIFSRFCVGK